MVRVACFGRAGAIALALGVFSCAPGGPAPTSASAEAIVASAQARYRRTLWHEATGEPRGSAPVIAEASASRIDVEGGSLVPRFPAELEQAALHRIGLSLPAVASAPLHLQDLDTGLAIDVALAGAAERPAEVVGGYVVYRGAADGADVVHRPVVEGTEDYVLFDRAPASPEVVYDVGLVGVAGLRLVDGVLELLDPAGTPRLRVARPYLVGADGAYTDAALFLEGCAADRNPVPPWGRAVTPAGAGRCRVRISWRDADVVYPALLDPLWSSAGSFASNTRGQHRSNVMADGRVLVSGGQNGNGVGISLTEIYDPASNTWSTTGPLAEGRLRHSATTLTDGKILAVGGGKDQTTQYLQSAEIYDPAAGTWSPTAAVPGVRRSHVAALLQSGKVIVAGGSNGAPITTAAIYDPVAGTWSGTPAMKVGRVSAGAALLDDGRFLVAGGFDLGSVGINSSEVYDPTANAWTATGTMGTNRGAFPAVELVDGTVLAVGGLTDGFGASAADVDSFDPATNVWTPVGPMTIDRDSHTATLLSSGFVLVTGGENYTTYHASSEIYDPISQTWTESAMMSVYRVFQAASLLQDGSVLVSGGRDAQGATSERYTPYSTGTFCANAGECLTGFCVQSYCCDTACDGACVSCLAADTGAANGTCAPLPEGTDPEGDCLDDGAPSCQQNGLCDGAGACQKYADASGCTPSKCTDDAECASGHCIDGICCDAACDGECEACLANIKGSGVDGECGPIAKGTDPDNDCGDDGSTNCDKILLCDGAGHCAQAVDACDPYVCLDSKSCKTSCNVEEDCAAGFRCKEAKCIPEAAECDGDVAISPQGEQIPCAPYTCDTVALNCKTSCNSVSDCAAPNVCNESKQCVPPPSKAAAPDDGCGCRVAGGEVEEAPAWLALGLVALAAARRRARR